MKQPSIEFPTSPDFLLAQEIMPQSSHHKHPLCHVQVPELFTCSGCKEYGAGYRFTCKHCDFQLHEFCALAPSVLQAHPFHIQHRFIFVSKPVKNGISKWNKCDVCGKATKGNCFRCTACNYQMHPCCAMLSYEINISVHPHPLRMLPAPPGNGNREACRECNRRRPGRVYGCTVCEYHLHAVCAKDMVNGLQANGWKLGVDQDQKPSILGKAARVASQVVIEFIGGLIEGLGEGVGQMLIQTVARSERRPPPYRPPLLREGKTINPPLPPARRAYSSSSSATYFLPLISNINSCVH